MIQGFRAGDPAVAQAAEGKADVVLLDAAEPGSGRVFDWKLAEGVPSGMRLLLAGGLSPENVADAIRRVRPWGVDVATGVEGEPGSGRKDARKLTRFLEEARRRGHRARDRRMGTGRRIALRLAGRWLTVLHGARASCSTAPGPSQRGSADSVSSAVVSCPRPSCPRSKSSSASSATAWASDDFRDELGALLTDYAGRPTPVTECHRLSERLGVRVLLKREDLTHTGSHKINNVLGQALLTRRMGKQRVIAETGAGQHGVATATAAALFGLDCTVFMGAVDVERQALNVFRMRLLGAEVIPVESGSANAEGRDQRGTARLGGDRRDHALLHRLGRRTASVPVDRPRAPADRRRRSPRAVPSDPRRQGPRHRASRASAGDRTPWGRSPAFLETDARLVGVEAGGRGLETGQHGASVAPGRSRCAARRPLAVPPGRGGPDPRGALHQRRSRLSRASAPSTPRLAASGRAEYESATDDEAIAGFELLAATEGIVPALEPAHALGWLGTRSRSRGAERRHGARHALRPGRQGRGAGRRATRGRSIAVNLETRLRARRDAGAKLLVPYVTGGLGVGWVDVVRAVADAGADAIEIGIPFSDPVMDGTTIQEASQRALELGATPTSILTEVRTLDVDVPLVVMTYYNPVHHAGHERFASSLAGGRDRRGDRPRSPARRARRLGGRGPTPREWRPCSSPRRRHPTTDCGPSAIGRVASSTASRSWE